MAPEIIAVIVVVALAALGYFVWQGRQEALPAKPEEPALPPAKEPLEADKDTDRAEAEPEPESKAEPEPVPEPEPKPEEEAEPLIRFEPPPSPYKKKEAPAAVPLPVEKPRPEKPVDDEAARTAERERYQRGLAKTRGGFVAKLSRLFKGRPKVDDALKDDVEEVLFTADIGSKTAQKLLDRVTEVLDKKEVAEPDAVWSVIREASLEILDIEAEPPDFEPPLPPYVLLMIGVNGVGKTTTLGKLAARHVAEGRKVLLVAADTFRAAAVEQLDVWAQRVGCDLHRGVDKGDPSSVVFDGIVRGRKEGYDVVLCDTAGRLHTRKELMDELGKVRRAAGKAIAQGYPEARRGEVNGPHDTYLVLDATIGQNALAQALMFKETMDFTGLVITKLDGTAKGGVVLGICDEMRVPVRYIGIGEGVNDLREFEPHDFADALYADRERAEREAG